MQVTAPEAPEAPKHPVASRKALLCLLNSCQTSRSTEEPAAVNKDMLSSSD